MAGAALLVLGGAVYGWYVFNGGFSTDDWSHAAAARERSLWQLLPEYWGVLSGRPVDVAYLPLQHVLLGPHPALHIAWTLLVACGASVLLYAALRQLRFEPRHAFPVAALVLVFPYVDGTRLWSTANLTQLAVVFSLAGLLVALRGLRESPTTRKAVTLHGAAFLLYVLGIFTYEATGPVIALFGPLYRTRAPWRRAARLWATDVAIVVLALTWTGVNSLRKPSSLDAMIHHAGEIAHQGSSLLAQSALPFGYAGPFTVLAALAIIVGSAALLHRLLPRGDDSRPELVRWVRVALAGVVLAYAGWLMFVPAADYFVPLARGLVNRTNAVAAIGIVLTVYACAVLGATLLFRGTREWTLVSGAVTGLVAVAILVAYVRDVRRDMHLWAAAVQREDYVLATLDHTVGRPAHGTVIYTFAYPGFHASGVPIFVGVGDLSGALKLHWGDPSLTGYPVFRGVSMSCGTGGPGPVGPAWVPQLRGRYGRTVFVDLRARRAERIATVAQCRDALPRFRPG